MQRFQFCTQLQACRCSGRVYRTHALARSSLYNPNTKATPRRRPPAFESQCGGRAAPIPLESADRRKLLSTASPCLQPMAAGRGCQLRERHPGLHLVLRGWASSPRSSAGASAASTALAWLGGGGRGSPGLQRRCFYAKSACAADRGQYGAVPVPEPEPVPVGFRRTRA